MSETVYGGSVAATKMRAYSDANLQYEMDASDPYVSIPVKFFVTAELESPQPDMILQVGAGEMCYIFSSKSSPMRSQSFSSRHASVKIYYDLK